MGGEQSMSRKKILLFFQILFKIVGSSIVWIFLTFIPAGLQIYEFLGGDITMLKQLPAWVWFAPLGIYICYSLGRTVYEWLIVPQKIKFSEMQRIHRDLLQSPLKGYKLSGGIDITIPENWNIEDCYVTLEKAVPVYYKDHILIDSDEANLVSSFLEPEFKMLLWKSPFASSDCKINIGENGNTEMG